MRVSLSMSSNAIIFDRNRLKHNKNRSASKIQECDYLFKEVANRLIERLEDTNRSFPMVLELGSHTGQLKSMLSKHKRIKRLFSSSVSKKMLAIQKGSNCIVCDEEYLSFKDGIFDLVMSLPTLHWVNNLPMCLLQIRNILSKNGILLASFFGGKTLTELRQSILHVDMQRNQGASPRIAPFVDVKDAGMLLQSAGFSMPVADCDTLTVEYSNPMILMQDLHNMGESNILSKAPRQFLSKSFLSQVIDYYQEHFCNNDGSVYATFDIITLTAMK